ncbi:MAG: SpoIIE family protein phosphatase [Bacteroidia bacterium]|nr:SpoIIE family protein phosphatase [Bacteroidia bacterium]
MKNIFVINIIISFAITVLLIILLPPLFNKYEIKKCSLKTTGEDCIIKYVDLDSDGYCEMLSYAHYGTKQAFIHIHDQNEKIIGVWNLLGDYIKNSDLMYGDFNNNGYKEIYIFTQKGDSVFINGNEIFKQDSSRVLFYNKFIDTVKKSGGGFYDYSIIPGKLMDINNDNRKEIIFDISAGFSLVPRRIYAYDIINDTVYKSPQYGNIFPRYIIFYDIDNDGKEEIMGSSRAGGNYPPRELYDSCKKSHDKDSLKYYNHYKAYENIPYWNSSAWLMCFNSQLKLLFEPVEFKEFTSDISVYPYKYNITNYFAVLYSYWGKLKLQTFIALYDTKGKTNKTKNIEYKPGVNLFTTNTKNRDNLYLLNEKGFIYKLDNNLDTTETYDYSELLGNYSNYICAFDIDNDSKEEQLFYHINKGKLIIFRENLSDPITFEEKIDYPRNFSIKYNGKNNPQFSFKAKDKHYLFEYKRNEKYLLKYIYYIGIFIILLVFITLVQLISSYKLKKDKQRLEKIVMERTQEIREKNIVLEQQKEEIVTQRDEILIKNVVLQQQKEEIETQIDEILHKNEILFQQKKEIENSIRYAKRIQTAVLPTDKYVDSILGEHFIIFKPKEIVSGDFYWATIINKWLIVTVTDCTGHGVPGAFMSMLAVSFLNEIVRKKEVINAAMVLNHLRFSVIEALQQSGKEGEQKDGMDMSLAAINISTNPQGHLTKNDCQHKGSDPEQDDLAGWSYKAQWAGANNPLWIIRNPDPQGQIVCDGVTGSHGVISGTMPASHPVTNTESDLAGQVIEIRPDKMPVAIYVKMNDFTNHEIQLYEGDKLFLFSDGYPDQFGGPIGKKFLYKRFKELLVQTCPGMSQQIKSMKEQGEQIEMALDKWMNYEGKKYEQIDDITVLGLQI